MNIIFLDIDGVLNTGRWMQEQYNKTGKPHSGHDSEFDPICLNNLKELVEETDSYIVISSTWRFGYKSNDEGWQALMERLDSIGVKDKFIDITPSLWGTYGSICCRGYEIQKWLDDNVDKNIESFVIIDDDADMFHLMHKLAKCDFVYGLNEEVKNNALKILKCDEL